MLLLPSRISMQAISPLPKPPVETKVVRSSGKVTPDCSILASQNKVGFVLVTVDPFFFEFGSRVIRLLRLSVEDVV